MSAIGSLIGLAITTVTAAVVVITVANRNLFTNFLSSSDKNKSHGDWIDPNGPKVQFVLFTRSTPPYNIKTGNDYQFAHSGYNASNPTKIIIHGFLSSIREDIFTLNKNAYLETGDYNVIGVDWSALCEFEYLSATRGVRVAGHYLGEFLNWLEQMGVPLEKIHIIGHSMGAHVAGIAGSDVRRGRIARITGLEPAKPGFENIENEHKLDSNDAKLVDIVHTYVRFLSLESPVGHVDFYPNGGKSQPGCPSFTNILKISESLLCNHGRAYRLFAESIRNKYSFRSTRCNSVSDAFHGKCQEDTEVYMGHEETYQNGVYYFQTRDNEPYSMSYLENATKRTSVK